MDPTTGWVCPTCKRGVRPDERTCDHGGLSAFGGFRLPEWPPPPIPAQPAFMPVCGCKVGSACANVACPHATRITSSIASVATHFDALPLHQN